MGLSFFLGTMLCPASNLSVHVPALLPASSEVQGGNQANTGALSGYVGSAEEKETSFQKGVDQANTGDSQTQQGKNKADITWMSSASVSLSPSAKPVPRLLCLDELLFDATAGSAATAPPLACRSTLPCLRSGTCPAPLPTCGLTLPDLGCGSGLVLSSVPWDEFVPGLWEYVIPEK